MKIDDLLSVIEQELEDAGFLIFVFKGGRVLMAGNANHDIAPYGVMAALAESGLLPDPTETVH